MGFLPDDYSTSTIVGGGNGGGGKYFKIQQGDNKVRILGSAVVGYLYWTAENKPVRSRSHPGNPADIRMNDDGKPDRVKHFWAVPVWDYANDCVCVWEITQRSIQEAIEGLYTDEDWGNPVEYDIKIKREGEKLETKYNVIASPKKPLSKTIAEEWDNMHLNLYRLYDGGDPFQEGGATNAQLSTIKELRQSSGLDRETFMAQLKEAFGVASPMDMTEEMAEDVIHWMQGTEAAPSTKSIPF